MQTPADPIMVLVSFLYSAILILFISPTFPVTSFLCYQVVQALKVYSRILVCFTSECIFLFGLYTGLIPAHSFKLLSKLPCFSYIKHEDQQRGS